MTHLKKCRLAKVVDKWVHPTRPRLIISDSSSDHTRRAEVLMCGRKSYHKQVGRTSRVRYAKQPTQYIQNKHLC